MPIFSTYSPIPSSNKERGTPYLDCLYGGEIQGIRSHTVISSGYNGKDRYIGERKWRGVFGEQVACELDGGNEAA